MRYIWEHSIVATWNNIKYAILAIPLFFIMAWALTSDGDSIQYKALWVCGVGVMGLLLCVFMCVPFWWLQDKRRDYKLYLEEQEIERRYEDGTLFSTPPAENGAPKHE